MKVSIDKKKAFLAAFIETASLTKAARIVEMDRGTHYDWLASDPEYHAAYQAAREQAGQSLEDDAVEWARKGIFEPLVYQGEISRDDEGNPIGIYRRSEGIMLRLLKAFMPARYADRAGVELSGSLQSGPISLEEERLKTLTDAELAQLIATARKLAAAPLNGTGDETPRTE